MVLKTPLANYFATYGIFADFTPYEKVRDTHLMRCIFSILPHDPMSRQEAGSATVECQ